MKRVLAGIALLLLTCSAASAQSTTATVHGIVRGAAGRPVRAALVQARSAATGIARTASSDGEGRYRFTGLPGGEWNLVARGPEGGVSESVTVRLALQQTIVVDLNLGSGFTEEVEVRGETALIDVRRTGGELRVLGDRAEQLPINGRSLTDLALLDSSVRQTPPATLYGEKEAAFVINGMTGRSNAYLVDGLDNNDQTSGTNLNAYFSQLVVKELVVLTHQYGAEFGRASGGVFNIVTDRGGNDNQIAAFMQGTFGDLSRSGDLVDSLPGSGAETVSRFQAGFKAGGPIKKDKAFYFLAYEHQRSDEVRPYTGIDRSGVAGGRTIAPIRGDNLFFRTDFNVNLNDQLMVRALVDDRKLEGLNVGGLTTPESGFRLEEQDLQLAVAWTRVRPRFLNEMRLLVGTSAFDQFANSDRPGVSRPSGRFGGNDLNQQLREEDRIQLVENITWQRGNHTVKFGADVTRSRTDIQARFNPNGGFFYDTDAPFEPGDGFDFFTGADCVVATSDAVEPCPGIPGVDDDGDGLIDEDADRNTFPLAFTLLIGEPRNRLDDTRFSIFAQDSWQVRPNLLIDYGLRYDLSTYTLPPSARVDSTIPNGGAGRDTDNIAPRFGFTWNAGGRQRFVVRGGAGIFYDKLVLAFPAVAAVTSGTELGIFFPQGFGVELDENLLETIGIDEVQQNLQFPQFLTLRFSTGTTLDTPYAVQANLGFEGRIRTHASFKADLVRTQGYHLPLMRDLNPVDLDAVVFPSNDPDVQGIPLHFDQTTGSIAAIVTEGRTWYTGLDLGWRWQSGDSWLSASYTLSRVEDMGPDPLKGGIYLPPSSLDLAGERGRADYDRRHRLVLAGATGLMWGLRGSAVVQFASGVPFNVTSGGDENLDGIPTDRPDGIARNTGEDTPLSLVNALRAAEGLAAVASLNEPSLAQVDLRLWRPFSMNQGRSSGQIFLQVFNLLDRFNGGLVEGRVTARGFGQVIGQSGPPRTVEGGIRFDF